MKIIINKNNFEIDNVKLEQYGSSHYFTFTADQFLKLGGDAREQLRKLNYGDSVTLIDKLGFSHEFTIAKREASDAGVTFFLDERLSYLDF